MPTVPPPLPQTVTYYKRMPIRTSVAEQNNNTPPPPVIPSCVQSASLINVSSCDTYSLYKQTVVHNYVVNTRRDHEVDMHREKYI